MTKKYIKHGAVGFKAKASPSKINQFDPKLPHDKRQALHQELKSSGSIDLPDDYIKAHLEGGIEDEI